MHDVLKLYPNPARHEVTLLTETRDERQYLIIRNCLGEQVLQQEVTSTFSTLSLSDLRPGLYFAELKLGQRFAGREKLVIE